MKNVTCSCADLTHSTPIILSHFEDFAELHSGVDSKSIHHEDIKKQMIPPTLTTTTTIIIIIIIINQSDK
jgi:hypothetical protein